jgi:hypothetical protein
VGAVVGLVMVVGVGGGRARCVVQVCAQVCM